MSDLPPPPAILCKPFLVDFSTLEDRIRAFGGVREAVADLTPEPLPGYERLAQQQFLECLDAMSWGQQGEAQAAARAMFDRLFWSWRSEELRIVEINFVPFALDTAWSPPTVKLFAELWTQLAPVLDGLRPAFDRALGDGEIVGRFEDFRKYAHAWGDILERGAGDELGLIVVQYESA
jgi:hypothetical protein